MGWFNIYGLDLYSLAAFMNADVLILVTDLKFEQTTRTFALLEHVIIELEGVKVHIL